MGTPGRLGQVSERRPHEQRGIIVLSGQADVEGHAEEKLGTVGHSGKDSDVQGEGGWGFRVHETNVIYVEIFCGVRDDCFAIIHGARWCGLEEGLQGHVVREAGVGAVGDVMGVRCVRSGECVLLTGLLRCRGRSLVGGRCGVRQRRVLRRCV